MNGVIGEVATLDIHIHCITVHAALYGGAVLRLTSSARTGTAGGCDVIFGRRHQSGRPNAHSAFKRCAEINVASFKVGGVGVCDIGCNQLLPMGSQVSGILMETECSIKFVHMILL